MDTIPIPKSMGHGTKDRHAKMAYLPIPVSLSCLQAFGGFRSATNLLLHDIWTVSRPTVPLPPPLSVFYPLQRASPIASFCMAEMESCHFLHSDPASMGYSNGYCPTTASFACPCLSQNCEARGDGVPYLFGPAGNLNMQHNSGCTLPLGVMSTPTESTTSRSPDKVRARQVDSIFANRNPWVNGRLRSQSLTSSRYCGNYWMSVSSKFCQKDIHSALETSNQQLEPEEEWISISQKETQTSSSNLQGCGCQPGNTFPASTASIRYSSTSLSTSEELNSFTILESSHLACFEQEFEQPRNEDDTDNVLNVASEEEYEMVQYNTTLYDLDRGECISHSLISESISCDFEEDENEEFL